MTEIARELLEGVSPGDYVRIRYGTNEDQITVEGTIVKWSENFLSLQKADGDLTRIRLDDSLRALDQKKPGEAAAAPVAPKPPVPVPVAPAPVAVPRESGGQARVLRQMATLSGYGINNRLAYLFGKRIALNAGQLLYIIGPMNCGQNLHSQRLLT